MGISHSLWLAPNVELVKNFGFFDFYSIIRFFLRTKFYHLPVAVWLDSVVEKGYWKLELPLPH